MDMCIILDSYVCIYHIYIFHHRYIIYIYVCITHKHSSRPFSTNVVC